MGLILHSGEIVELENICTDPINGFEVKGEDLDKHEDHIEATWHTHPNQSSNLSFGDYQSFLNYPDYRHYIVGSDGVSLYTVGAGKVLLCDAGSFFTDD